MYIVRVQIHNFRSVINQDFSPTNLNLIVGDNDIGKSNLLRALNLFFNGETSFGQKFNFEHDFAKKANTSAKKAEEIKIILTFRPPASYKENRDIVWTKKWRKNGLHFNEKKYSDGNPLEGRRKVGFWLDQMRYRYVPAIKGSNYFSELLRDLHDVLAQTISAELRDASAGFVQKIRAQTNQVSLDLMNKLGIDSKLQIPQDLSTLFKILEFETSQDESNISLDYRGDGIKVRHIPIILKFIAEQENAIKQKGSPKINTIWGYEEPENNLELTKAFDKASELFEYSSSIQIFATTHSPAFYSLVKKSDGLVHGYFTTARAVGQTELKLIDKDSLGEVDIEMGILPLITPHIKNLIDEKKQLLQQVENLQKSIEKITAETLFVEGPSDKAILETAFEILYPLYVKTFIIEYSSSNGGGHAYVKDMLISWQYNREKRNGKLKAAGLFDEDRGSKQSIDQVNETGDLKGIKVFRLRDVVPKHLITLLNKGIKFPYAIEEFFPVSVWAYCEKMGWLEPKADLLEYNSHKDITKSFRDVYIEKGITVEQEVYFSKIKPEHKQDFVKYVTTEDMKTSEIYQGFDSLILQLQKYFS